MERFHPLHDNNAHILSSDNKMINNNTNEQINDNELFKLFYNYKYILSAMNNKEDCEYFINNLNMPLLLKRILLNYYVTSLVDTKNSDVFTPKESQANMSMLNMMYLLKPLNNIMYKDDIKVCIDDMLQKTEDPIQQKTLQRFINSKPNKPIKLVTYDNIQEKYVTKNCPHCGHFYKTNEKNKIYAICGYSTNLGYDWTGCQKDWCFQCGKKLCKSWDTHDLNIIENRSHDDKCCKKDAKINKKDYKLEYCQCAFTRAFLTSEPSGWKDKSENYAIHSMLGK